MLGFPGVGGISITVANTYRADARLSLGPNGAFSGEFTLPDVYTMTFGGGGAGCHSTETGGRCWTGPATCTFTRDPEHETWEVTGRYRDEDERLVFTNWVVKREGRRLSWVCPPPIGAGTHIEPADLVTGTEQLALAFADGASTSFPAPPPPPGMSQEWDVTLQLEYPPRTGTSRWDCVLKSGQTLNRSHLCTISAAA